MSDLKTRIIDAIIEVEGGFVDDPNDSGGATNFGITEAVARANGYDGYMGHLPREVAFRIYAAKYWDAVRADDLLRISAPLAEEVVDTAVNMGPARAGKFLQRALNALNDRGRLYSDLVVDGGIGPATIAAAQQYWASRGATVLVKVLNCLQGAYYIELSERREKDERFVYGCFKTRVAL